MNDILPPKRPNSQGVSAPVSGPRSLDAPMKRPLSSSTKPVVPINPPAGPPLPTAAQPAPLAPQKKKKSKKKLTLMVIMVLLGLIIAAAAGVFVWYNYQLTPIKGNDNTRIRIDIEQGLGPRQIGDKLEEKGLIRSSIAFDIFTRLSGTRSKLQAGTYSLSPSESTQAIVEHIVAGKVDQFKITFLPGATLAENRQVLVSAGYSADEVDQALAKTYNSPLFVDKPAGTDLEGYIYGETYQFGSSASVENILQTTFEHYGAVITENKLVDGFKAQGLTLYQGITLASIIQREVGSNDQKQVAQVFLTRLKAGMPLGSDVTYQYAAKKLGVTPSPELDSPYNTRKYIGLPPGPISTPGKTALEAVANPASGDYLFFLSGDDGKTYFSHTDEEHQAAIRDHCQVKCSLP